MSNGFLLLYNFFAGKYLYIFAFATSLKYVFGIEYDIYFGSRARESYWFYNYMFFLGKQLSGSYISFKSFA